MEWNSKVGVGSLVGPEGPESITAGGGVVSTVHSWEAGEPSTLPALSIARASNLWVPSLSSLGSIPEAQGANAASSSLHSKEVIPKPPGSSPLNSKLAEVLSTSAAGLAVSWVSGAVESST